MSLFFGYFVKYSIIYVLLYPDFYFPLSHLTVEMKYTFCMCLFQHFLLQLLCVMFRLKEIFKSKTRYFIHIYPLILARISAGSEQFIHTL